MWPWKCTLWLWPKSVFHHFEIQCWKAASAQNNFWIIFKSIHILFCYLGWWSGFLVLESSHCFPISSMTLKDESFIRFFVPKLCLIILLTFNPRLFLKKTIKVFSSGLFSCFFYIVYIIYICTFFIFDTIVELGLRRPPMRISS